MFTLQAIFGKADNTFEMLTASAREGLHSVEAVKRILNGTPSPASLDELIESRRKSKEIAQQLRESLVKASGTAIAREEVEQLSTILYYLPKTLEKFAERYLVSVADFPQARFDTQVKMLDEAAQIVVRLLYGLKKNDAGAVREQNSRLQQIESDADRVLLEQYRVLYSGRYEPTVTIALKDLYDILEKSVDHCRDAGNIVAQIVLKHS